MKKFNWLVFIISSLIVVILTTLTFISTLVVADDGAHAGGVWKIGAGLFEILCFPSLYIFNLNLDESQVTVALGFNCLFYGLLLERLYSIIKK